MLGYTSILKECVHFTYKTQPNVTMGTSLVAQTKESVCNVGELDSIPGLGRSLGWEDPLEEGVATHSSILAWRIPLTEEPGRL